MKLAEGFANAMSDARGHVASACGGVLVVTLEAMGYRIVPKAFVDTFMKVLQKSDDAKEKTSG